MKRIKLIIVLALMTCSLAMAQKREGHEFYRDLPVYGEQLIKDRQYQMAWGTSKIKNFSKWRKAAREKTFELMMPAPPRTRPWDMKVLREEQRDGYKAQLIEFNLSDYYRVKALLLIPDGKGPFPAVNALHDHGAHLFIGKEKMIRPFEGDTAVTNDAQKWADNLYDGQFMGDYLAKNGFVVFSSDAPMWGDRGMAEGPNRDRYDMIAGNMMMYGIDLSAYMTYDDIACTEFMASLPCVDPKRIGCTGLSMGAYRSWMLAALSDRIKVCTAVCWMATMEDQMTLKYGRSENGGFANCIPGLRQYLDYPHITTMICPRPFLMISGDTDGLFPAPGVKKAYAIMHDAWKSQKAEDVLSTELWHQGHHCGLDNQKRVLEFLKKYL